MVEAVRAGCDALLYPQNVEAVVHALDRAAAGEPDLRARADSALQRVASLAESEKGRAWTGDLTGHVQFADATADVAMHTLRVESLHLHTPLDVVIVDDDVGGPYSVGRRDLFTTSLKAEGLGIGPGGSRIVLIYSEPRSWKGHASLSGRSAAAVGQLAPRAGLVILFGHPRLLAQVPGDVPVLCAWHGPPLMQKAAARWVGARLR